MSDNPVLRHDGEREWLEQVVDNLRDDDLKLVYADWLEERGDDRSGFLREFAAAATMDLDDFSPPSHFSPAWLDLLGFDLLRRIAGHRCPDLRDTVLRLVRPALRMVKSPTSDADVPVGGSKLFGLPDLPPDVPWPRGDDCRAIYNDSPEGREELAGFLGQVNLAEIAGTFAARILPKRGLLSFFCFQDWENDDPDTVGVRALLLPDPERLERTEPPEPLTAGNEVADPSTLGFEETLDLPESYDGPWSDELANESWEEVLMEVRERNFENVLGYGRATTGGDPTTDRESRHLILLDTPAECRMHVQIPESDLKRANFDAITLAWVDFD